MADIYIGSLQYFEEKDQLKGEFLKRRAQVLGEDDFSNYCDGVKSDFSNCIGLNCPPKTNTFGTNPFSTTPTSTSTVGTIGLNANSVKNSTFGIDTKSALFTPIQPLTFARTLTQEENAQIRQAEQANIQQQAINEQPAVLAPKDNTMLYVGGGVALLAVGGLIYALTSGGGGGAETTLA